MDDVVEGQEYVNRVFGAGESAEAHLLLGIAHLGQHDYRAAKTELETALQAESEAADCALALRPRAAARSASRTPRNAPSGVSSSSTSTTSRRTCSSATCASARSGSPRRRPISSARRRSGRPICRRASCSGACGCRPAQNEEAVAHARSRSPRRRQTLVEVHVQLATAYNRLKRKEDARARARDRRSPERRSRRPSRQGKGNAGVSAPARRVAGLTCAVGVSRANRSSAAAQAPRRQAHDGRKHRQPKPQAAAPSPEFDKLVKAATEARQAERWDEAIGLYAKAGQAEARLRRGLLVSGHGLLHAGSLHALPRGLPQGHAAWRRRTAPPTRSSASASSG